MSSSEDEANLMASFKRPNRSAAPPKRKETSVSPAMFFSDDNSAGDNNATSQRSSHGAPKFAVAVRARPLRNRDEFTYYEPKEEIERILREFSRRGNIMYEVKLADGQTRRVSEMALYKFVPRLSSERVTTLQSPSYLTTFCITVFLLFSFS